MKIPEQIGFTRVGSTIQNEKKLRRDLVQRGLPFGVSFLDAAFRTILPHDLVLVGARTGAGKTELLTTIARTNALKGTKVAFFALEAEENEIERRMKYSLLIRAYKQYNPNDVTQFNFRDWFYGDYDAILASYEDKITQELSTLDNLMIFYRKSEFSVDDFEKKVMAIKDEVQLIVVDHIHIFDLFGVNENRELSNVIKRIKDLVQLTGKPVVLAGHLRKSANKQFAPIIGDESEFMGSSDLSKIVTKAIMLSSDPHAEGPDPNVSATLVRAVKFRMFGSVTRYLGQCFFNTDTNEYLSDYHVVQLEPDERSYKYLEGDKIPSWLVRRKPNLKSAMYPGAK